MLITILFFLPQDKYFTCFGLDFSKSSNISPKCIFSPFSFRSATLNVNLLQLCWLCIPIIFKSWSLKKKKYLFSENLPDTKNKYLCRFYPESFGLVLVLPDLSTSGSFPGTSYTAMLLCSVPDLLLLFLLFFFKPKQNGWLKIYLHLKEFKRGIGQITKSAKQLFLNYLVMGTQCKYEVVWLVQ